MKYRKPNMAPTQTPDAQIPMPERLEGFDEIHLGYTLEQAQAEADRCLNCPDRYCSQHCPAHSYIPEFIAEIRKGDLDAAWELIARTNPMMEISGRVCPYENQCESHCTRAIKCEPVAIGRLERFVADWQRQHHPFDETVPAPNGTTVAIVGSGPAGLSCAASLVRSGTKVTVYEKEDRLGGIPVWGIPAFVLPPIHMERQVQMLHDLGVEFRTGTALGRDITLAELREKYDAVFLATGAGRPAELDIPGRTLAGVVQAEDYLKNPAAYPGRNVAVIGGGNTAIDAARVALRRGADRVQILYRRLAEDMPATRSEQAVAREEGAVLRELTSPVRFLGENGRLTGIECDRMALTKPDYPGGRNNSAPSGERFTEAADLAILALGFGPIPVEGVETDAEGRIVTDAQGATSLDGVYAGGDNVNGASTLMKAVAGGVTAAAAIFTRFEKD